MSVKADEKTMLAHLQYMFGGLENHEIYSDGRIEIGTLTEVNFFPLDKLEKAARYAVRRTTEGSKVYVHAGLIRPEYHKVAAQREGRSTGHSGGDAVLCWPCLWGEADHKHLAYDRMLAGKARNDARLAAFAEVAEGHGLAWGWISATGTVPSLRLQGFIRLDEPAPPHDPRFWSVLKSMSRNGNLDVGANNSSQVLRLAGSVSFASASTKKGEEGEAPRIDELVTCIACREGHANLAETYELFDVVGLLSVSADTSVKLARVKNLDTLAAMVRPPENAPTFERDRVREAVAHVVRQAAGAEVGRRDAVLKAARTVGGLLWTGAFDPEEIIAPVNDDPLADDDDPGLSLVAAYEVSGGANDNGVNHIDRGIIDAMASGAAAPLSRVPMPAAPSDGGQFGAVIDEGEDAPGDSGADAQHHTPIKVRLKSYSDFAREYAPPEYVLDTIVQAGSLYTLSAKTGSGKTVLLASAAVAVGAGRSDILGADTKKGRVAYFSFENPDDFRLKIMAAARAHGVNESEIGDRILICDARVIPEDMAKLLRKAGGDFAFIVVDTLQAGFDGDDSNNNVQTGAYMRRLRPLCALPGKPAVVVAAHPVKGAQRDNLAPYGGGAVVNEVDGNLTLWKADGKNIAELHWQVKFRGVPFEPVHFIIEAYPCPDLLDNKGRALRLPVIKHLPASAAAVVTAKAERKAEDEAVALLKEVEADPGASLRAWGQAIGRDASTVKRRLEGFELDKLAERVAGGWRLTTKGRKQIAAADEANRVKFEVVDEAA